MMGMNHERRNIEDFRRKKFIWPKLIFLRTKMTSHMQFECGHKEVLFLFGKWYRIKVVVRSVFVQYVVRMIL